MLVNLDGDKYTFRLINALVEQQDVDYTAYAKSENKARKGIIKLLEKMGVDHEGLVLISVNDVFLVVN